MTIESNGHIRRAVNITRSLKLTPRAHFEYLPSRTHRQYLFLCSRPLKPTSASLPQAMQLLWSHLFLAAYLWPAGRATASRIPPQANKRQDGPVDPSTAKDCTYFDTAIDKTYTCQYFEQTWGLSAADFLDWVCLELLPP